MWILLPLMLSAAGPQSGVEVGWTSKSRMAEYQRLADELNQQAKRNNWVAVERLFSKLEGMGQPHSRRVLVSAAHAASDMGNTAATRDRLLAAEALQSEEETKQWLWRLQEEYGPVVLSTDLPMNYRLEPAVMPFSPEHRRAVQFGQAAIVENSHFEGYLPRGRYIFAPYKVNDPHPDAVFEFDLRAQTQRFERRTRVTPTRRDRRKRARIDRRIARQEAR